MSHHSSQLPDKAIQKAIAKEAKKVIQASYLNTSTKSGNKELSHLASRLAHHPFIDLAAAQALGTAIGQKIVTLSQQANKADLDAGIIQRLVYEKHLPDLAPYTVVKPETQHTPALHPAIAKDPLQTPAPTEELDPGNEVDSPTETSAIPDEISVAPEPIEAENDTDYSTAAIAEVTSTDESEAPEEAAVISENTSITIQQPEEIETTVEIDAAENLDASVDSDSRSEETISDTHEHEIIGETEDPHTAENSNPSADSELNSEATQLQPNELEPTESTEAPNSEDSLIANPEEIEEPDEHPAITTSETTDAPDATDPELVAET